MRGELLEELLSASARDPDGVRERARRLGADLDRPQAVGGGPGGGALRGRARWRRPPIWRRRAAGWPALHDGCVVLCLPDLAPGAAAATVRRELTQAGAGPVTVGGGGPARGPAAIAAAHAEAARCAATLVALGRSDSAGSADELGFFGLLVGEGRDVRGFVDGHPRAGPGVRRKRGTDLVGTLQAYFDAGGSPARAAEALRVHVNTVTQRLDRVGRLLGKEWSSPERALEVQLALRLHRLTGAVERLTASYPGACSRPRRSPALTRGGVDGAAPPRTRRGSTAGRHRTASAAAGARRTPSWTSSSPTTPRRPAGCAAGTRARGSSSRRRRPGPRRTPPGAGTRPGRTASCAWTSTRSWPTGATPSGSCAGCSAATAARPAFTAASACTSGRWSTATSGTRHPVPLRLGQAGTDAVVEAHPIRCTHFDAFRFFTPPAVGRNRLQPDPGDAARAGAAGLPARRDGPLQVGLQAQPGDPGELVADCFELAVEIRELDMRASPYDLREHGYEPVAIETPEGKAQYVAAQRGFAERGAVLRQRLLDVCDQLPRLDAPRQVPSPREHPSRSRSPAPSHRRRTVVG